MNAPTVSLIIAALSALTVVAYIPCDPYTDAGPMPAAPLSDFEGLQHHFSDEVGQ
jgi:hypothetical protein